MDIFKTEKEVSFLCMNIGNDILSLSCEKMPLSEPIAFNDLFAMVDVSNAYGKEYEPFFCANIISNRIAHQTRRARGNILFVSSYKMRDWFLLSASMIQKGTLYDNIIIDSRLDDNELRCAFWVEKRSESGELLLVDGGIQYSPEGFSCLPNYQSYFTKCHLSKVFVL